MRIDSSIMSSTPLEHYARLFGSLHTDREGVLQVAVKELLSAVQIGQQKVVEGPVIHAYVDAEGAKEWSTPVVF